MPTSISTEPNAVSSADVAVKSVPLVNVKPTTTSTETTSSVSIQTSTSTGKVEMRESSILPSTTTNTQLRRSERGLIPIKPKPYDHYLLDTTAN